MKLNLKIISLITILGTLFYFLGHNNKNNNSIQPIEQIIILDKKINSANLLAPKVYISGSAQNYLGIGEKINSRK